MKAEVGNVEDNEGLKQEIERLREENKKLSALVKKANKETLYTKFEDQSDFIDCIIESIADCFIVVDENWIVTYWNKAAEKLLKKTNEEIIGRSLPSIYTNPSSLLFYKEYQQLMQKKEPVQFEEYLDEFGLWLDISTYPFNNGLTIYFKDITQRKKQALEIAQIRESQTALINATSDLLWLVDTELKLVSFNKAYAERIFQFTGKLPFAGMQLPAAFVSKEKKQEWESYYRRSIAGEIFSIDETFTSPTTTDRMLAEIRFNTICGKNGEVTGVICQSHDVTSRVQTQILVEEQNEKLRASEKHLEKVTAKLQKVMDSSLDVICSIDKDGCFKQVSKASEAVWGYTADELIDTSFRPLVHPNSVQATEDVAVEIMAGGIFTNFQNTYIHKNGSSVPLIWSARWDDEEEIMFCVARDATALKEAEKLTAETESRFTMLVQKGVDLIGILDAEGRYLFTSPNIEYNLGYKPEELLNRSALDLIHPDDIEIAMQELEKVVKGEDVKLKAFRFKDVRGEWHWFETIATNQIENPAIKGIVVNSRDITDRIKIEAERELMIKELLKSNADLKQFSFITSHNLRAPLSNIQGILNIVDYKTLDDYNRQMVQMLDTSTKQLQQTVDDLSKIMVIKNNVNIELSAIDLVEAVDQVKRTFINTLNDFCVEVVVNFSFPQIEFNKVYFESILVNLVSNSIKYRSPDRNLCITISSHIDEENNPVIVFADNGIGIDLNRHKTQVFGLYQRFHNNIEGQGLGLFIIKSQIVALGGKIEVESEANVGTIFTITLKKRWEQDAAERAVTTFSDSV